LRYNTSQKHVDRLDTGDQSVQHVKFPTIRTCQSVSVTLVTRQASRGTDQSAISSSH